MDTALPYALIAVAFVTSESYGADRKGIICIRVSRLHELLECPEGLILDNIASFAEISQGLLLTYAEDLIPCLNNRFSIGKEYLLAVTGLSDLDYIYVIQITPVEVFEASVHTGTILLSYEGHDVKLHIEPFFLAVTVSLLLLDKPLVEVLEEGCLKIEIPGCNEVRPHDYGNYRQNYQKESYGVNSVQNS